MRNNIINKVVFEAGCRSEQQVSRLRSAIEHFALPMLERITEEILQEYTTADSVVINKLEIDLGEIGPEGWSNEQVSRKIGESLRSRIKLLQRQHDDAQHYSPAEADRQMIFSFLLTGRLPWWVENSPDINLRKKFEALVRSRPGAILQFLEENEDNQQVMTRIRNQFGSLLPQILPVASPQTFVSLHAGKLRKGPKKVDISAHVFSTTDRLHVTHSRLASAKLTKQYRALHQLKLPLIRRLLEYDPAIWSLELMNNNGLLPNLADWALALAVSSVKAEGKRREISLEKLSLPQLKLLLMLAETIGLEQVRNPGHHLVPHTATSAAGKASGLSSFEKINAAWLSMEEGRKNAAAQIAASQYFATHSLVREAERIHHTRLLSEIRANKLLLPPAEKTFIMHILRNGHGRSETAIAAFSRFLEHLSPDSITDIQQHILAPKKESSMHRQEAAIDERIVIANAGLCLVANYLPSLFRQLGYIEEGKFISERFQQQAICLLQYLASGRKVFSEHELMLNKLLCGMQPEDASFRPRRLKPAEIWEAEELLNAVICNWSALRTTSIKGFRESFLQRQGILRGSGHTYTLQVEKKGYDLLLGSIPWSYTPVKLSWMKHAIHVEW